MHIKASRRDRNDQEKSSPAPWVVLSTRVAPFLVRERIQASIVEITSFPCPGVRNSQEYSRAFIVEWCNLRSLKVFIASPSFRAWYKLHYVKMLYVIQLWESICMSNKMIKKRKRRKANFNQSIRHIAKIYNVYLCINFINLCLCINL